MAGLVALSVILIAAAVLFVRLLAGNRHRLRAVVRFTRGHAIATLVMALMSPVGVVLGAPYAVILVLTNPDFFKSGGALWVLVYCVVWYIPASLVVSGVHNKWLRVLALFLFWLALVSCVFLVGRIVGGDGFDFPGIV